MSDEMERAALNDRPELEQAARAEAKQEDPQVRQSQASVARPPGQRSAPGRRPLFRT
jgi:hypothetical protein